MSQSAAAHLPLSEKIAARRFDPTREPGPLRVTYSLADIPISTPGNLTAVTAAIKTGKSAFEGAMLAAPMEGYEGTRDTLSISSSNPCNLALVHIDTEQSPDDHWRLISTVLRRARAPLPSWLHSFCLTGFNSPDAFSAFKEILERAANECGGIHSCHIDGVADLVGDVNDAGETNAFVSNLHDLAIQYDCPIVGVIHHNPGSEKSRGHLGSQLERKAESNLTLKKEGEVTVVYSTKQRRAPILEATGPRFRWCPDAGMHVTCNSIASERDERRREGLRCHRDDVFGERTAMRFSEVVTTAKTVLGISQRTAERRVEEWRNAGLIEKSVASLWTKRD